jgi:hypothetical protein
MDSSRHGISCGRRGAWFATLIIGFALLLAIGPTLTAMAGPAQEKEQEEDKEKKDKPKVFTNKDLRPSSGSSGSGETAAPAGDTGSPQGPGDEQQPGEQDAETANIQTDPWDSVGVAVDSSGRGEAYWRQAMTEARAVVTAARREHEQLQSEMNRNRVDFTAIDDPAARALVQDRIQELDGLLSDAAQAVTDAEQALSDLEEDARQSGALPGWLR